MSKYTYTIFDSNPVISDGFAWPTHTDVEIEADDDDEARDDVRTAMGVEAAGLNASDGYEVGQTIYAIVWDADGVTVGDLVRYELTAEDMPNAVDAVERMDYAERLDFARTATAGDYLIEYEDCGISADDDPRSLCGYAEEDIAELDRWLGERDLRLIADDAGLVVAEKGCES